jgi:hypothetical protein
LSLYVNSKSMNQIINKCPKCEQTQKKAKATVIQTDIGQGKTLLMSVLLRRKLNTYPNHQQYPSFITFSKGKMKEIKTKS